MPKNVLLHKSIDNTSKNCRRQLFSVFWKLATGLQQSGSIYSRKMAESWQKQQTLWHFNLLFSHTTLSSSTVALKINSLKSWKSATERDKMSLECLQSPIPGELSLFHLAVGSLKDLIHKTICIWLDLEFTKYKLHYFPGAFVGNRGSCWTSWVPVTVK